MTMMAAPIARLLAALWLLSQPSLASIRSDFIHAMQQVEREHQMEQADRRLQQRLWDVARPLRRRLDEDQDSYVSVEDYDQSLDLTNYAFKYVGCQSIHTWSDDLAEDESSTTVLGLQKFVIFRLCELDSCSDYNRFGCMYNYGEYLVDMSDYLEIMHDNHRTMMSTYCSVCAKCLTMDSHIAYYQNAASSNAATDDASKSDDATDDAVAYGDDWAGGAQADDWSGYNKYWGDGGNRKRRTQYNYYGSSMYNYGNGGSSSYASSNSINRGGNSWFNWWSNSNNFKGGQSYYNNYTNYTNNDDAQANDDAAQQEQRVWYSDEDGKCIFEEVCNGYNSACKNFDSTATNSENYLACTEFDVGNNVGGYLGPHCRSDGVSIGIGMFEDENCNVYVSDVMDSGYTAQSFGSDDLAPYYDTSCVSCKASEGTALITDDAIAQQEYTYPFCSAIYYQAAKCNRYFRGDSYSVRDAFQRHINNRRPVSHSVSGRPGKSGKERAGRVRYDRRARSEQV